MTDNNLPDDDRNLADQAKPFEEVVKLAAHVADNAPERYRALVFQETYRSGITLLHNSPFARTSMRPKFQMPATPSTVTPPKAASSNEGTTMEESLNANPEVVAACATRLAPESLGAVVRIYGVLAMAKELGHAWVAPKDVIDISERLKLGIAPKTIHNQLAKSPPGEVGRKKVEGRTATMYSLLSAGEKALNDATKA